MGKNLLGTFALVAGFLLSLTFVCQADDFGTGVLLLDPAKSKAEEIRARLDELESVVARYAECLNETQRKKWQAFIHDPAPETIVPVDKEMLEWLYKYLEQEPVKRGPVYWSCARPAFRCLCYIAPNSKRTLAVAQKLLAAKPAMGTPAEDYVELMSGAIYRVAVQKSANITEELTKLESPDFWVDKADRLSGHAPGLFAQDEHGNLMALRSRAAWIFLEQYPDAALAALNRDLSSEPKQYREALESFREQAKARLAGTTDPEVYPEPPSFPPSKNRFLIAIGEGSASKRR